MRERPIRHAWKACVAKVTKGSNPLPSALLVFSPLRGPDPSSSLLRCSASPAALLQPALLVSPDDGRPSFASEDARGRRHRRPSGKRSTDADGSVRVHGKGANGEGSVYFATDGRWRATYKVAGETRPRTVSASTREKAIARRAERVAELEAASVPSRLDRDTTIAQLATWWLEHVQRHQVRPASWALAQDRVTRIVATLGAVRVRELQVAQVVTWQSSLLEELAPKTVAHHCQTLAQVIDQAVELGLVASNPVRRVKPPTIPATTTRALTLSEIKALVAAAREDRYAAAVGLLFLQGWRVSEVLGLAWSDVDLDAGTVRVARACNYVDGVGKTLGPTKTTGALGRHRLVPTVVELLRARRAAQLDEQQRAGAAWLGQSWEGRPIDLVFTTATGDLVLRQTVTKAVKAAAIRAGLDPVGVATHTGRRSVVTALFADGGESIDEIARFVGHASPATTATYVRDLGERPTEFARRAATLLDPQGN